MFSLLILTLVLPFEEPPKKYGYPNGKILIEPGELAVALKEEGRRPPTVLDCRAEREYRKGHVPGAILLDAKNWAYHFGDRRKAGTEESAWRTTAAFHYLHRLDQEIVIYDDLSSKDAARVWWILRYLGFTNAKLLNGGWSDWLAGKYATSTELRLPVEMSSGNWKKIELQFDRERFATKETVHKQLESTARRTLFIDARSEDEFCGKANTAKRNGAIPGSKHLEWSELLDKDTHRFKSPEELKKLFDEAGIDLNKPLITYCQSGGRASVMAFALELMGAKNVKNYYASWAEWGNADDTPIEPGKAKDKK